MEAEVKVKVEAKAEVTGRNDTGCRILDYN